MCKLNARLSVLALRVAAGVVLCVPLSGWAIQTEIQVKLFGQPCTLQGPASEEVLRAIHAISPEQVIPIMESEELGDSGLKTIPLSIKKLREQKSVPPQLDRYRERLIRRLDAYIAFIQAVQITRTEKSAKSFLKPLKKHLKKSSRKVKAFEAEVKQIPSGAFGDDIALTLFEKYGEVIEPDPEDEFHRAIRRMKIKYGCSFDEAAPPAAGEGPKPE